MTEEQVPSASSILLEKVDWQVFEELGESVKLNECKSIDLKLKSDLKTRLGSFIRADVLVFYQTADGAKYISKRDYIYGISGNTTKGEKLIVWAFNRDDNSFITKLSVPLYETPQAISQALKKFGNFGPWNLSLLLDTGMTTKEKHALSSTNSKNIIEVKPAVATAKPAVAASSAPPKNEIVALGKSVKTDVGDFVLVDHPSSDAVMVTFEWKYPGGTIDLVGSFTNWRKHHRLHFEGDGHVIRLPLDVGTHQYKFIVDGFRWCYDVRKPHVQDSNGNVNNVIVVNSKVHKHPKDKQQKDPKQKVPKEQKQREKKPSNSNVLPKEAPQKSLAPEAAGSYGSSPSKTSQNIPQGRKKPLKKYQLKATPDSDTPANSSTSESDAKNGQPKPASAPSSPPSSSPLPPSSPTTSPSVSSPAGNRRGNFRNRRPVKVYQVKGQLSSLEGADTELPSSPDPTQSLADIPGPAVVPEPASTLSISPTPVVSPSPLVDPPSNAPVTSSSAARSNRGGPRGGRGRNGRSTTATYRPKEDK